jgi:outer membrane immunogenic protein
MKRSFALTAVVVALIAVPGILLAGPERIESKEMAAAPAPPPCNWTGFYLGVHGGFGAGAAEWRDVDFGSPEGFPANSQFHEGAFGGGQLGFNYQFGHFVLGLEGDFSFSDVGGDNTLVEPNDDTNTITTNNNWTGTIAARLGYAFDDNHLLFYVKGGAAIGHWEYEWVHQENPNRDVFTADDTRTEPMVGLGVEYMFGCHWSASLECRYVFLGADNVTGTSIDDGNLEQESYQIDLRQVSARIGINYKIW